MLFHLNETAEYLELYWPLVLNDLKYIGQYWNQVLHTPPRRFLCLTKRVSLIIRTTRLAMTCGKKFMDLPSLLSQINTKRWFKVPSWLNS